MTKNIKLSLIIFPILFFSLKGMSLFSQYKEIPLWPERIRGSNEIEEKETVIEGTLIANITEPTLTIVLPEKNVATGSAVVICPGGGYVYESIFSEGTEVAKKFALHGIAGIVLKYRLPNEHADIPLLDAQRAIRVVRYRAKDWDIDSYKIGILGFSAGGHLASTAGTHFENGLLNVDDPIERISCRPDFMILVYPVITMKKEYTHLGSRTNLLGEDPDSKLIVYYSNEMHVTTDTPPTFLIHADDDKAVPAENSILFYKALRKNNVSSEIHIYEKGGHGFGLGNPNDPASGWFDMCITWIRTKINNKG